MTTKYGVSFWDGVTPQTKRMSWPRHRGHLDVDVAIVGGGLTGCATAYVFAAGGVKVALFEAERLAGGATRCASGLVLQDPSTSFSELSRLHGVRTARHVYQATHRAALDLVATLKRLGVRCDLTSRASVQLATTDDEVKRLKRELAARREAGIEAGWVNARRLSSELAIEAQGGIRRGGDAQLDPLKACLGMARAAASRGALLFEHSSVRRVKPARKWIDVTHRGGTVRAQTAIVATGSPPAVFGRSSGISSGCTPIWLRPSRYPPRFAARRAGSKRSCATLAIRLTASVGFARIACSSAAPIGLRFPNEPARKPWCSAPGS